KGMSYEDRFDHIVLSVPAHAAARIAGTACPDLQSLLHELPYTSSTLVYLAYKKNEFSHPLDGFGFIVPEDEAHILDACTWVSRKFDGRCPPDKVLLRVAIHDGRRERPDLSDAEITRNVHNEIVRFMGISCAPIFQKVFRIRDAIPQLLVGHVERTSRIRSVLESCPGVHLAASFYGGVGIPDCIQTAKRTADAIASAIKAGGR
ncbi:MAG: protoporphyrinogen/coproporphyrinogen oxidase, partial [bacterium]